MSIENITADSLRRMNGKEGLVLQGCGGDPREWLDADLIFPERIGIVVKCGYAVFSSCSGMSIAPMQL